MTERRSMPARRRSTEVNGSPASAGSAPSMVLRPALKPERDLRRIERMEPELWKLVRSIGSQPLDEDVEDDVLARLRRSCDALERSDYRAVSAAVREAAASTASRADLSRVIAAMFDGLASFRVEDHPAVVDAFALVAESDIEERPRCKLALALAAREVLKTERFAPPAGVFLDAVRAAANRIANAVHLVDQVDAAIARVPEIEAANTPEARARRTAERAAASERHRQSCEFFAADLRRRKLQ